MQRAETRLRCIAKIEVVMTGGNGQQGDWRSVCGGTGSRATAQVHIQYLPLSLQQRSQLQGITLGIG
ncbi:hypothetical protein D3C76_1831520 [compost metagenome]